MKSIRLFAAVTGFGLIVAAGCSSARFGAELNAAPKKSFRVAQPTESTTTFPTAAPFNIISHDATEAARLLGTAHATATAEPAGTASASAQVERDGSALGEFQLGQQIQNGTGRQADFSISVQFAFTSRIESMPDERLPDASNGLRLFARSSTGRMLQELALLGHTSEEGCSRQEGMLTTDFTITLGPDESAAIYLAGQAKVDVEERRKVDSELTLADVQIKVHTQPAPPVGTQGDDQH